MLTDFHQKMKRVLSAAVYVVRSINNVGLMTLLDKTIRQTVNEQCMRS